MTRRVLVIGATGAFGTRLIDGLLATTDLAVVLAARNLARLTELAEALRRQYPGRTIETAGLDAATITAADIRRLAVWCVADLAGPYQDAPPRTAEAAIHAGAHYVDIADARDFVARFPALDARARAAGVLAATGASSTPALSQAALDDLTRSWRRIDDVEIVIAPGNRQPRGLSVVRGVLARAGRPMQVFNHGAWRTAWSWGLLTRRRLPGVGRHWLSVVDTPDLDLAPARLRPTRSGLFRASLELPVMHLGLWALSGLVRAGLMPNPVPLAEALQRLSELVRGYGTDRGTMCMTASGIDADGNAVTATWALIATKGDGPQIPPLPALAVIRGLAAGTISQRGALVCAGWLPLAAMVAEFQRFHIVVRRMVRARVPLLRALGRSATGLPPALLAGHAVDRDLRLRGRAEVIGAANGLGRRIAALVGFPPAMADTEVEVTMRADADGEAWVRRFGNHVMHSRMRHGRRPGHVCEAFGPMTFDLSIRARDGGIDFAVVGGRLGPVPMPRFLLPRSPAREQINAQGRFSFDVPVALPLIGRLVHYRGWLIPVQGEKENGAADGDAVSEFVSGDQKR